MTQLEDIDEKSEVHLSFGGTEIQWRVNNHSKEGMVYLMKKITITTATGILFVASALWAAISWGEDNRGKMLYTSKCQLCHGVKGDGKGHAAAYLGSKPADFTDPKFWKDNDDKKIARTIENGQNEMPAFELKPDEMKALIDYLHSFNPSAK